MAAATSAKDRRRLYRDVVMTVLALVSIGVLVVEEVYALSAAQQVQLLYFDLAIVAVFWVEYLYRLWRAPENPERYPTRWEFVKANWYDLPGMVPILPGMEGMAGVRILRLLRILRILRLIGALRRFDRFDRAFQRFAYQSKLGYVVLFSGTLIVVCASVVWVLEEEANTFGGDWWNALWWAIVTVTTVGYGDYFPRTGWGRMVAMILMFLGVALIGTLAATLSSFLVESRFQKASADQEVEGPAGDSPLPGFAIASELERLERLHQRGALTDQEFAAAKRRLLG